MQSTKKQNSLILVIDKQGFSCVSLETVRVQFLHYKPRSMKTYIIRPLMISLMTLLMATASKTVFCYEKVAKNLHYAIDSLSGIDSLLQYFEQTTNDLEKQVSGLSAAQLAFKPAADKWSVSQCLEHIVLSETMLFEMAKKELQKEAQPQRRKEVKVTNENLKQMMGDRTQKFQAPQELQPLGKYTDSKTALSEFKTARAPVLAYIKQADEEDLRNHISEYPTGTVNGYQNLLFIAAHMARHIKQIEEIKANPNFPKQ